MVQPMIEVHTLAHLRSVRCEAGLPPIFEMDVPAAGVVARDLASEIGLPLGMVEGVFHNHRRSGLDVIVRPGDRVAFVPHGTPASHPAFFGAFA